MKYINGKVNKIFEINLAENITTGHSWAISRMPHNICFLGTTYTPKKVKQNNVKSGIEKIVGIGGTRTFIFGGIAEGEGTLELIYVAHNFINPVYTENYYVVITKNSKDITTKSAPEKINSIPDVGKWILDDKLGAGTPEDKNAEKNIKKIKELEKEKEYQTGEKNKYTMPEAKQYHQKKIDDIDKKINELKNK